MPSVVITGAGRGIGYALARAHAAHGWAVTGTVRGKPPSLPDIEWLRADVTDRASLDQVAAGVARLDRLVCNAGIYAAKGRDFTALTAGDWAEGFAVNVTGVAMTVAAFVPALLAARGQVAIVGSQMGSTARAPGGSHIYRATKAAVLNLGRNLATDLAGQGVAVGIYHPGWVRTDMGGAGAEIGVDASAEGLMARMAALSVATTGCFEGWDGRAIAF